MITRNDLTKTYTSFKFKSLVDNVSIETAALLETLFFLWLAEYSNFYEPKKKNYFYKFSTGDSKTYINRCRKIGLLYKSILKNTYYLVYLTIIAMY